MKVVVIAEDGTQTDVTDGVRVLYDNVLNSMNWGSGFLDNEEAMGIVRIAQSCGFATPDEARETFEKYVLRDCTRDINVHSRINLSARVMPTRVYCVVCNEQVAYVIDSAVPEYWNKTGWWRHINGIASEEQSHEVQIWKDFE